MAPIRLVTLKSNGRRFILLAEEGTKVRCKGDVLQVSGWSVRHAPDRIFMRDRVDIEEVEPRPELYKELWLETLG